MKFKPRRKFNAYCTISEEVACSRNLSLESKNVHRAMAIILLRIGLSRLCRHFFENNRQALAFENNTSILGGICSILGGKNRFFCH